MLFAFMMLGVAKAKMTDRVYYTFHDSTECNTCTQETLYIIDDCFETEDDNGVMNFAKATWITEGVRVQLAFYGRDATCAESSMTEGWPFDLEQCVFRAGWGSESVSAEPWDCTPTTVWYIWDEYGTRCNDCHVQTRYNIGECTRATVFDRDIWAMMTYEGDGTVRFTQHNQDDTCTSASTETPVVYTLDQCLAVDGRFSEIVSRTAADWCSSDAGGGLNAAAVILWIVLPLAIIIGCLCCATRRRRPRSFESNYAALPAQQPVYAQPQAQVYAQPVAVPQQAYAQPVAYPQQAYPQQQYAQQPPMYAQDKPQPYAEPTPPQY